jgi:hypothetical protein
MTETWHKPRKYSEAQLWIRASSHEVSRSGKERSKVKLSVKTSKVRLRERKDQCLDLEVLGKTKPQGT